MPGGNGGSETRRSLRLEGSTWPSPLSTCRPAWLRTRTELKAGSRLSVNQILTWAGAALTVLPALGSARSRNEWPSTPAAPDSMRARRRNPRGSGLALLRDGDDRHVRGNPFQREADEVPDLEPGVEPRVRRAEAHGHGRHEARDVLVGQHEDVDLGDHRPYHSASRPFPLLEPRRSGLDGDRCFPAEPRRLAPPPEVADEEPDAECQVQERDGFPESHGQCTCSSAGGTVMVSWLSCWISARSPLTSAQPPRSGVHRARR